MINSSSLLEINLKNLIYNYKELSKISKTSITGATIKANAYGLGDAKVFKILYKNHCRHFFFATLEEAISIRKKKLKGNIYVLNGLENNHLNNYEKYKIIPILNSAEELQKFIDSEYYIKKLKIGIHVETGLNRLGITKKDLNLINSKNIEVTILVSHLASSDELNNNYNNIQNKNFQSYFKLFKSIKYKSLISSLGILQNKNFHYDITRPGIALYGGHFNSKLKKIIKPVIKLKTKVLQVKNLSINQYVGYNQTYKTKKNIKIAILGIGYGDGISRELSNIGIVYKKNEFFKIIGRISMDTTTIDITKNKNMIKAGMYLELINEKNDIEKIAKKCNTISNEILTSISKRVRRVYI